MRTIGLIGVGYVGTEFLDQLLAADYDVVAFDVDDEAVDRAVERGAAAADSPAAVARETDAVVTALPGTPELEATLEGDDGLLDALSPGQPVVDATTTRPATSVVAEELCDEVGADFLEAPITGAAPRDGYQMMIGGTAARYEAARDLLDTLCDDHVRVGPIPDGTVLKLGLQMRYAGRAALDAEIVEYARDNGVDPRLFGDFFGMDVWERYHTGEFGQAIEGLGGLAIWDKDLGYAREFARRNGTALPLSGVVHEAYKAATRRADEDEGHAAALIRYWMALNDAEDRYE
ncbi:NAD(P)-dependent oxidoreductase [Halomicrobium salinisoli]|uniref:NAD(P)-dependent oxidoreductase n=1 Tax=Halomicrobium salinisoli TaxID=2878391 RepID=UPI001CF03DDB|nr:NAD(P)-binding domain-containing protein [Halomicrobium salinisoli]